MKARITIVALVFLLLGVTNADAQKHYYKGKKCMPGMATIIKVIPAIIIVISTTGTGG
ncbi:hypothetical protein LWM68_02780 [Niabella sp. W65]|nr:hypothetical protein [Niabella sp. W65]MCH7361795.1 hypothetical protein [Niabella sp. W65]ULT45560.1 hypothetical protein KRR40_21305 [Niabella sp. I65]